MAYCELSSIIANTEISSKQKNMKIMIFTEGTVLGPKNMFQHFNHKIYIPIGNCISKIKSWEEQGAQILYFTSRKKVKQVNEIREILKKFNFPGERLYYREEKEKYKDIIEFVVPDILIEDDCQSIGGKWQMCITYVNEEVKSKVNSIVLKEFEGIDNLPLLLSDI